MQLNYLFLLAPTTYLDLVELQHNWSGHAIAKLILALMREIFRLLWFPSSESAGIDLSAGHLDRKSIELVTKLRFVETENQLCFVPLQRSDDLVVLDLQRQLAKPVKKNDR